MLDRVKATRDRYPQQFWLLVVGLFISTVGTSMIWPFMTIYVSERLDLPLTDVAGIITLNGFVALFASFVAGPITDRFGRKWPDWNPIRLLIPHGGDVAIQLLLVCLFHILRHDELLVNDSVVARSKFRDLPQKAPSKRPGFTPDQLSIG